MSRLALALAIALILPAACSGGTAEGTDPSAPSGPTGPTGPTGATGPTGPAATAECASPGAAWIWCDDFESNRLSSYFEVKDEAGAFTRVSGVGQTGSYGMRVTYPPGNPTAGNFKLAFGVTPAAYVRPVDAGTRKYREIYWRMFVRTQAGWTGQGPKKLSRAMVLATSSWQQAAVGHVWTPGADGAPTLQIDPARGTDAGGIALRTTEYNDVANFTWLGAMPGTTQVFSAANANAWFCVEAHMRLNDAGQSNGVFELWINQNLEARQTTLNWLGSYAGYGINAIFFENYWDGGSPVSQSRYFDNIVVSTERIGCSATM